MEGTNYEGILFLYSEIRKHLQFVQETLLQHQTFRFKSFSKKRFFRPENISEEEELNALLVPSSCPVKDHICKAREIAQLQKSIRASLRCIRESLQKNETSIFTPSEEEMFFRAAILSKERKLIYALVKNGCSLQGSDYLLHKAVINDDEPMVEALLELGYPVNIERHGHRPLHIAATRDNPEVVQVLLNYGAI